MITVWVGMNFKFKHLGFAASCAAVSVLAGCSIAGFGPDVDQESTASLTQYSIETPLQETVDPSDWDVVRIAIQTALADTASVQPLQWQNDTTGSVGTIVPMEISRDKKGVLCRKFSTTLNGVGGVLQYRGDACRNPNGDVELVGMAPYNAVVDASGSASDNVKTNVQ